MRLSKNKSVKLPETEPSPPDAIWEAKISEAVSKALQSFYPRMSTLDSYSQQLAKVDEQVTNLVQRTVVQTTVSYWITFTLYVLSAIIAVGLIGAGLYFILVGNANPSTSLSNPQVNWGTVGLVTITGGLIILLVLLIRNPLKNVRFLMSNMIKMNVVFSGYIRQVHQIDLVFKNLFVQAGDISPTQLQLDEVFKYLQDAREEAMDAISEALSQMDE